MANTDVTLGSARKSTLSNQARAQGFTHKFKILYTDIDEGAGSTDTVTAVLGNTPADFVVTKAMVNITTAFAGTTAMTIKVGTAGDPDGFITATSVLTAGPIATQAGATTAAAAACIGTTAQVMEALFTNSSGGSPSALSAGEMDIYLAVHSANDLG